MSQIVYTENVVEYLTLSINTRRATDFNFSLVPAIVMTDKLGDFTQSLEAIFGIDNVSSRIREQYDFLSCNSM
jgi:hypothetical protein